MTFKNNRAPLLSIIKLYASFHHHMWIQTGVTVRKQLSWVVTSVTLTFDLGPWPFAWTSLLSLVITPANFMMIRWWEHGEKGVTDGQTDRQTDGQTDWTSHIAAWSQLKMLLKMSSAKWGPFYLGLNELNKQSVGLWFEMTWCSCDIILPANTLWYGKLINFFIILMAQG